MHVVTPLSPETVDRKPVTDDERAVHLNLILEQARELVHLEDERVTCPCGHQASLPFAFHCYHCGVWLCRRCAARHFGDGAHEATLFPRGEVLAAREVLE